MTNEPEKVDPFESAGIEAVMASLAKQYISDHCEVKTMAGGMKCKVYNGDLHVLQWYQAYDHKKKEAYASKQTQIQKGV